MAFLSVDEWLTNRVRFFGVSMRFGAQADFY